MPWGAGLNGAHVAAGTWRRYCTVTRSQTREGILAMPASARHEQTRGARLAVGQAALSRASHRSTGTHKGAGGGSLRARSARTRLARARGRRLTANNAISVGTRALKAADQPTVVTVVRQIPSSRPPQDMGDLSVHAGHLIAERRRLRGALCQRRQRRPLERSTAASIEERRSTGTTAYPN